MGVLEAARTYIHQGLAPRMPPCCRTMSHKHPTSPPGAPGGRTACGHVSPPHPTRLLRRMVTPLPSWPGEVGPGGAVVRAGRAGCRRGGGGRRAIGKCAIAGGPTLRSAHCARSEPAGTYPPVTIL